MASCLEGRVQQNVQLRNSASQRPSTSFSSSIESFIRQLSARLLLFGSEPHKPSLLFDKSGGGWGGRKEKVGAGEDPPDGLPGVQRLQLRAADAFELVAGALPCFDPAASEVGIDQIVAGVRERDVASQGLMKPSILLEYVGSTLKLECIDGDLVP